MCFLLHILGEWDSTISLSTLPCILRACERNQCGHLNYTKYKLQQFKHGTAQYEQYNWEQNIYRKLYQFIQQLLNELID